MSLVLTITVTNSALSATSLPPKAGSTTASTMATSDHAVQEMAELARQKFVQNLLAADANANANTTATVSIA